MVLGVAGSSISKGLVGCRISELPRSLSVTAGRLPQAPGLVIVDFVVGPGVRTKRVRHSLLSNPSSLSVGALSIFLAMSLAS